MSLRTKAIVIICVALLTTVAAVYATSRFILISGLSRIENYETKKSVQRSLSVLSQTVAELEVDVTDWAVWDDTYAFVADANEKYVQRNLADATFIYLGLNLMLFTDSSGRVVFSKAFDLDQKKEVPVSPQLLDNSSRTYFLGSGSDAKSSVSGVIVLQEGPMIIAAQPILKSDYSGPVRGTLVFGRYLDATELSRLAQLTLSEVSLRSVADVLDADFREALPSLSTATPILVQTLSTRTIAGYTLLKDIRGNPALILRVAMPRDASLLGQTAVVYHILTVLVIGLLVVAAAILIVQRQVIARFAAMSSGLDRIATTGDIKTRLPISGNDELTLMARTMNGVLVALEESSVELRAREERYRLLAENVQDVIFTTDMNLRFSYLSPSITKMTGYTVEEAMPKTLRGILTPVSQEVAGKALAEDMSVAETDRRESPRSRTLEIEMMCKDGSTKWAEVSVTFMRDDDGRATGILGVARDIAERKEADAALNQLYREERHLRQELQAEIAKRMEYTRALVHELKTPITPIIAAVDLLLEQIKEPPLGNLVKSISRSATHLNQRIDELLDLARSELDMLRIYPEAMDPTALLKEIANEMIPVGLRNRQSIVLEIPPSLPVIKADRGRIRQVILNLLSNALKFTPAGGKIILSAQPDGHNLVVSVSDTGPGISEEQQQGLFDPYQRVEEDRQRLSGLGLGLALAKKFVELHGGTLWVKSERGKGSTFRFSLPVAAANGKETGEPGGKT